MPEADVLGILQSTDLLIADVSSVTLDHLYLRPAAPIVLCNRRSNREQLVADAPIAAVVPIVDEDSIDSVSTTIASLLEFDPDHDARTGLRNHYFDTLEPGRSTERFWIELGQAMTQHDSALGELSRLRVATTGDHS